MINKKSLIVTGIYGSGKTEFSVNYAMHLKKKVKEKIYIADLDTINPYFRSREKAKFLEDKGIEILGNTLDNATGTDLPYLSYSFTQYIKNDKIVIVDLAGSVEGLKVIAPAYEELKDVDCYCVINMNRFDNSSKDKIKQFVLSAEKFSRLKINGFIHNTHLLRDTNKDMILRGEKILLELEKEINIKTKMSLLSQKMYDDLNGKVLGEAIIFKNLTMREDWQ